MSALDKLLKDAPFCWSGGMPDDFADAVRADLSALRAENERLKAEAETCRMTFRDVCHDLYGDVCTQKCDSYGHEEDCRLTNAVAEARAVKAELSALWGENAALKERAEELDGFLDTSLRDHGVTAAQRDALRAENERLTAQLSRIRAIVGPLAKAERLVVDAEMWALLNPTDNHAANDRDKARDTFHAKAHLALPALAEACGEGKDG